VSTFPQQKSTNATRVNRTGTWQSDSQYFHSLSARSASNSIENYYTPGENIWHSGVAPKTGDMVNPQELSPPEFGIMQKFGPSVILCEHKKGRVPCLFPLANN